MRLKSFTGGSMNDIMRVVRRELGDDAIIVSSWTEDDGRVRVTAALERSVPPDDAATGPQPVFPAAAPPDLSKTEFLRRVLDYHGVPAELAGHLAGHAAAVDGDDAELALAAALDDRFRFAPVNGWPADRPIVLVGPSGGGKTMTAAKLAAREVMSGRTAGVLTTDFTRAGAHQQLRAFTDILGITLGVAESPRALADMAGEQDARGALIVDSPGVNPFDEGELAGLVDFVRAARAEAVLVLPAGIDPLDAADIAVRFQVLEVTRLITPRVDSTRRHGGILAAAHAGDLVIGEFGVSPQIVDGLSAVNPVSLARLLARNPLAPPSQTAEKEAAS